MRLNLREIIDVPGGAVPFDYEIDLSGLESGSIVNAEGSGKMFGRVINRAGVLTVEGTLEADVTCVCARCLKEFKQHQEIKISSFLAEELQNEDSDDTYLLDGDFADLDEIANTAFVLNTEQRILCKETCKGLCSKCGKDLNYGPCECREDQDPRLAVLEQLLEK